MSETQKKFYLTTPIYYVNARPHIGHAYTTIAADVIARRQRLLLGQENVWFLTGTDEHGQKIERSAAAAGIPPQEFADQVSTQFESLWKRMGITNNQYIRTTDPDHVRGVQKLFSQLYERGHIYLDSYTGQYSVGEEMFIDGPPGTIGPDGKPTETVTEENFYFKLSDFQLPIIDLIESGEFCVEPEARRNEVLSFLRGDTNNAEKTELSAKGTPYVPGALKDLSISRSSFDWGIPVPELAASRSKEKHVIYVWLDALANYMTAVGYGSDRPEDQAKLAKFWPADLHLVGKEIIRFHCIYWPAFLLAADLPLPKKVQAHGWLLFEESKMSKSRGNIVRSETILEAFGSLKPEASKTEQDLFGADVLRYFLLREIPFGQDGSFSFDALVQRYNSDLANGYGNLVSRTLAMIKQYFDGNLPSVPTTSPIDRSIFPDWWQSDPLLTEANFDEERLTAAQIEAPVTESFAAIRDANKKVGMALYADLRVSGGNFFYSAGAALSLREFLQAAVDPLLRAAAKVESTFEFSRFLQFLSAHVRIVDEFLSVSKPWKLVENDPSRVDILNAAAEYIRIITALLYPVTPYAAAKVWAQLGLGDIELAAKNGDLKNLEWGGLKPGTKLGELSPIFPRADKGLIQIMTDMETNGAQATTPKPAETADPESPESAPSIASAVQSAPDTPQIVPPIAIDDFVKIDLRVAKIIVAERIPKADKLLRLEVDLGYEKRQILSGIAEWYAPEDLIGRRIVVIANLAPRKMRGLESHGMLLAASNGEDGKPILATFADSEDIELGSRLK